MAMWGRDTQKCPICNKATAGTCFRYLRICIRKNLYSGIISVVDLLAILVYSYQYQNIVIRS